MAALCAAIITLPFSTPLCNLFILIYTLFWLFQGSWPAKLGIIRRSLFIQLFIGLFLLELTGLMHTDNESIWTELTKKVFLILVPVSIGTSTWKIQMLAPMQLQSSTLFKSPVRAN